MRTAAFLAATLAMSACGGEPAPSAAPSANAGSAAAAVDPAALYCVGRGGAVLPRTAGGRRADLCRLPDGRTVSAGDLLNSHNDL